MARILVVDDREADRRLLETLLRYAGHEVHAADDARSALDIAGRVQPDLAVVDLVLPEFDGFLLARRLGEVAGGAPVIAYSAIDLDARVAALAARCNIQTVIQKPAEPTEILEAVHRALAARLSTYEPAAAGAQDGQGPDPEEHAAVMASVLANMHERLLRLAASTAGSRRRGPPLDALTSVQTRRSLLRSMAAGLRAASRDAHRAAMMIVSLDRFRYVNETFGIEAGDALLARVAALLQRYVSGRDRIGRTSGDEFGVFLRGHSRQEVESLAMRIKADLCATLAESNEGVRPTVSIGVAFDDGQSTVTDLLLQAEIARWRARQSGDDQCAVAVGDSPRGLLKEIIACLERPPGKATGEARFQLVAQPIVNLATGEPELYELLLRMQAADGTVYPPQEVVLMAERYGLIHRIDAWVLEGALQVLSNREQLPTATAFTVNVSARTLSDIQLYARFVERVKERGIDPQALIIEVTETAELADLHAAEKNVEMLKACGIRIALDDFGSGFSTMAYARQFRPQFLKLGSEVVDSLPGSTVAVRVVKALVDLARALGCKTIAEHVSNVELYVAARRLGIDYGQGYYWGPPAPIEFGAAA